MAFSTIGLGLSCRRRVDGIIVIVHIRRLTTSVLAHVRIGTTYDMFKEAFQARGLVGDDSEWYFSLMKLFDTEAQMPYSMIRHLNQSSFKWEVVVRIGRLWHHADQKDEANVFHVGLIMIDECPHPTSPQWSACFTITTFSGIVYDSVVALLYIAHLPQSGI
ncbi:hypothetical protein E2562_017472 [Oryza meyeriana var. granulata]|uniref:Uncharacterized protein n=1 Tax=Oryza meyeriana var. granulata TaxID=110450 RepID=A0A6G1DY36_9ORYZ|nr:hypothetical protein E2562_017472 [Oryza meyeriana var. granulata]